MKLIKTDVYQKPLKVGQLYKVNRACLVLVRKLYPDYVLIEEFPTGDLGKVTYNNEFVPAKSWHETL